MASTFWATRLLSLFVATVAAIPAASAERHHVRVAPSVAAQVLAEGGKLVADYGAFQLFETEGLSSPIADSPRRKGVGHTLLHFFLARTKQLET
jgi:hypothetical protein